MKNSQQYNQLVAAFSKYANCVAPNAPRQANIHCILVHSAKVFDVCSFSLKETNINLSGGRTPGSSGVPGLAVSCLAQVSEPRATSTSKVKGATLSFLPKRWLLSLPVEYTFHDKNINPNVTLESPFSNTCSTPFPSQNVTLRSSKGVVIGHQTTSISASATVTYAIAGTPKRISTGPITGTLTASNGQFLQTVSCSDQTPLKQPSQIPTGLTDHLSQLSQYFTNNHICTFDPNSSAFVNLAEMPPNGNNLATLAISQEFTYSIPMTASWSAQTCDHTSILHTAAFLKVHPNASTGGGGCTPSSGSFGAQKSQRLIVNAEVVRGSAPVGYISSQECYVPSGKNGVSNAVCPKQTSTSVG
jgi:hypothetical protein